MAFKRNMSNTNDQIAFNKACYSVSEFKSIKSVSLFFLISLELRNLIKQKLYTKCTLYTTEYTIHCTITHWTRIVKSLLCTVWYSDISCVIHFMYCTLYTVHWLTLHRLGSIIAGLCTGCAHEKFEHFGLMSSYQGQYIGGRNVVLIMSHTVVIVMSVLLRYLIFLMG